MKGPQTVEHLKEEIRRIIAEIEQKNGRDTRERENIHVCLFRKKYVALLWRQYLLNLIGFSYL